MQVNFHDDVIEFFPKIYSDDRGQFLELYNPDIESHFESRGITFIQDNLSVSKKGVIRGMHLQRTNPQGKLIAVIKGSVLDALVDLRPNSKNFGKVSMFEINDRVRNMLWVPPGFAHGFQALEHDTIFYYRVTTKYDPADECSINPLDKSLSIEWSTGIKKILSEKDNNAPSFEDFMERML